MPASELLSGLVTGEFYSGSVDTVSDPDYEPDYAPAQGSGILVPSVRTLHVTRVDGSHYNVELRNFALVLTNGFVTKSDGEPMRLVANVNQYSQVNPTSWNWIVTQLKVDGITYDDFGINVDPNATCDLTVQAGVPISDSTVVVADPGVTQSQFDAFLTTGAFLGYSMAGLP